MEEGSVKGSTTKVVWIRGIIGGVLAQGTLIVLFLILGYLGGSDSGATDAGGVDLALPAVIFIAIVATSIFSLIYGAGGFWAARPLKSVHLMAGAIVGFTGIIINTAPRVVSCVSGTCPAQGDSISSEIFLSVVKITAGVGGAYIAMRRAKV